MKLLAKRPAAAAVLGGAVVLSLYFAERSPAPPPIAAPSVAVQTIALTQTTLPRLVQAYGRITGGTAEQDIPLPAPGIIEAVLVTSGQVVAQGQALARVAPDAQAAADLRKAEDAVQAAQTAQAHVAALLTLHLATSADLAGASQSLHDAQAQLAALRASGAGVARMVTAPFAGIVSAVLVAPGSAQGAGASLFRLADPAQFIAQTGVAEGLAAGIAPGNAATVTLLNSGTSLAATVSARAAMLDPQTGLIGITLALTTPATLGEPVAASIAAGELTGYAVPRDAVQADQAGDYIFQPGRDGLAHHVTVHVLGQSGDNTVLAPDGLNPALPVVTTGAYQLDDGMAVRPAAPTQTGAAN